MSVEYWVFLLAKVKVHSCSNTAWIDSVPQNVKEGSSAMSFKAEFESLLANASSSLEDLEGLLRRARSNHSNMPDHCDGGAGEIQAQLAAVRQRIMASLLEIRKSFDHDQERLSDLERELKLDLENVRQCAIDYFIKGEYPQCERLLTFLSKVQPYDENLEHFLGLSRRKQFENERKKKAAANSRFLPQDGIAEQRSSHADQWRPGELASPVVAAIPLAAYSDPDGRPPAFQPSSEAPARVVAPQILAEIELNTAAHIRETYRTPPLSKKRHFLALGVTAALGVATSVYWLSSSRSQSSVLENLSGPQSHMEEPVSAEDPLGTLRKEAQALFVAGKLHEAGRVCDAVLSKDPQDIFAACFKDTIRIALAMSFQRTAQLYPDVQPLETPSSNVQVSQKLGEEGSAQRRLAPKQAVAAPRSVAPEELTSQVVSQIRPDELLEVSNRIQAKEFDQARLLLERLEKGFPGNLDVKALAERLRSEAGIQQSLASSWIEKAWEARIAGRYVTPRDDNALIYCNLALKADPGNQRAAHLKKETAEKAIAQATDWIQQGKFDAARQYYASMDHLALGDSAFPYSKEDLKRELDKLEFTVYPMVHDHRLGSCSGILKFNSYAVSYVPSGGSGHGFTESLDSIVMSEGGERLKISCRDRNFRFRSETGDAVQAIYQQLMNRMTDDKSILATRTKDIR